MTIPRMRCGLLGIVMAQVAAALYAEPPMANRVMFFAEPNFRGYFFVVEEGGVIPNLGQFTTRDQKSWNRAVSSIRLEGTTRVTVFDATDFQGRHLDLESSVSDLAVLSRGNGVGATWDNSIASLAVAGAQPSSASAQSREGHAQSLQPQVVEVVPQRPPPSPSTIETRPTYTPRMADEIIEHAYRDILGRRADEEGRRHYREKLMRDGWTDHEVYADLQHSAEARAITPETAITKAYRDILGRAPDSAGLNHYRQLWRDGWSQGRIREDLSQSEEAREYAIKMTITYAYRELLGREPDPEGFANYRRQMHDKGWDEAQVRRSIMQSDEYRNRRRQPQSSNDSRRRDQPH